MQTELRQNSPHTRAADRTTTPMFQPQAAPSSRRLAGSCPVKTIPPHHYGLTEANLIPDNSKQAIVRIPEDRGNKPHYRTNPPTSMLTMPRVDFPHSEDPMPSRQQQHQPQSLSRPKLVSSNNRARPVAMPTAPTPMSTAPRPNSPTPTQHQGQRAVSPRDFVPGGDNRQPRPDPRPAPQARVAEPSRAQSQRGPVIHSLPNSAPHHYGGQSLVSYDSAARYIAIQPTRVSRNVTPNSYREAIPRPLPSNTETVQTPYGIFTLPNYSLWTRVDLQRELQSYESKFNQLNSDWAHLGYKFDLPRKNEPVKNVVTRYKETEKFLTSRTGSDLWFIIMCIFWGLTEYAAKYFKLPIGDYTLTQIKMYKSYQSQLTKIGATHGLGQEWSPMTQAFVMSMCSALLMSLIGHMCPGKVDIVPAIMSEVSGIICGNAQSTEMSEEGTPKPPSSGGGGFSSIINSAVPGGIDVGGMGGMITGLMGMMSGMGAKKKSKKSRRKEKKQLEKLRENGPEIDF